MIAALIQILVLALVLGLLYWALSALPFMQGLPSHILAVILAVVLLLFVLRALNLVSL